MERKRKLPARAARVETVSKKRTLTPPEQRTQTPTPAESPAPPSVVEEILPKKIEAGKPLPAVDEPQPENLPSREFQSIAESGVLPESLNRSRQKWITEGIFEKYWTKPTKKKGAPEQPPNNPSKDTMTKLGPCTITVEPHIFDVVMYAIKDTTPRPIVPPSQQSMYRPIIQYGPPGGVMPPPAPTPPPVQQRPITAAQPTPQPSPKTQDLHMTKSGPIPAPNNKQTPNMSHTIGVLPNGHPISQPSQTHPQTASLPPNNRPAAAPAGNAAPARGADPVIQMLAERAATDPDLKALMRIVANGHASPDELKRFQSHIDDLTRLQKARQAAAQAQKPPQPSNQPPSQTPPVAVAVPPVSQANGHTAPRPIESPAPPATAPVKAAPAPPPTIPKQDPAFQPQPQALRSKGPLPPKSDIAGVVFEFVGGSGDRFLFPKFSILEYLPGPQVVASFLIVRKGSSSDCPSYDPDLDYYQPITIRIYSPQARQLDALQKVVAPPEEVQRYMNEIMDKATRAEYVLLAMRLPRDTEQNHTPEKEDDQKTEQIDTAVSWATTNPTPPTVVKVKPSKKIPTEEEQYQTFISSVAAPV